MAKQNLRDMTKGNPLRLLLLFSIPLLIGNLFQQFYSMVDAIIVGRLIDTDALAAVGATGSVNFFFIGFIQGVTSGFAIPVAHAFGAKREEDIRRNIAMAAILSFMITLFFTGIMLVALRPLLQLMNTPANILDDAHGYMLVITYGLMATTLYNLASCVLRALGDSKTPLYFLILASVINVILDIFLIHNLGMGVEGAALATVIAQLISGVLSVIYMFARYPIVRIRKGNWKWNSGMVKKQLQIGVPMGLQFSVTAIGTMIVQSAINQFGSDTVAAYTAASKVEQLVMQPMQSLGVAMATYTGQNMGAGNYEHLKKGVRCSEWIGAVISIFGFVLMYVIAEPGVRLFMEQPNPLVLERALTYLHTIAYCFLPLSWIFIFRNTLQGMGDSFFPLMGGALELAARVLVAFFVTKWWGYTGICIANPTAWFAAGVPLLIVYYIKIRKYKGDARNAN
ncbi:MAG: MATE family efflux transporter [Lachnospiraceae bacterium]